MKPIPTFDKLFHPVLKLACSKPITRRQATEVAIAAFGLTPEEADARLASGAPVIAGRASWAMTFLTKAGLIAKVAPKTYGATEAGRLYLESHPDTITVRDLDAIPGFKSAWEAGSARRRKNAKPEATSEMAGENETSTPDEVMAGAAAALKADLRTRLLQAILDQPPEFFEQLVLDVLLAMGYGGSRDDAAERLGRSGDEGIDGRINQDALGLDQIMVQAKRYRPENIVDRKTIQAFIGSLAGQGVTKGVFITTSGYADSAKEFVLRGSTTKVVLVDGPMLIDLMIQHGIGVRVAHRYEVHEIDQNYFDENG